MERRLVLPLESCSDPTLVGGKAAGLGKLIRNGFPVPPGLCVTTAAYDETLRAGGIDHAHEWACMAEASDIDQVSRLDECRRNIEALRLSETVLRELSEALDRFYRNGQSEKAEQADQDALWAVRSSATNEDAAGASCAGMYHTSLGIPRRFIVQAIIECWASLWTPAALAYQWRSTQKQPAPYYTHPPQASSHPSLHPPAQHLPRQAAFHSDALLLHHTHPPQARQDALLPAMAVILQPLLSPIASGVAYSRHPVTGRSDVVAINSIFGLAEPLVSGRVTPDHFVIQMDNHSNPGPILERKFSAKTIRRVATQTGLIDEPVPVIDQDTPSLADHHLIALAGLSKKVEQTFGVPVDIEWAIDRERLWLLQARSISVPASLQGSAWSSCIWSRANLKETLPEVPSPLGLLYLERFMETNFLRHYRESGCVIPPGISSVRVIKGRPYINVSLFQSLAVQLGGNPELVAEQMGGEPVPFPFDTVRLPWWKLMKAGRVLLLKILRAARKAPAWFDELKQMGLGQQESLLETMTEAALLERLDSLGHRLEEGELTFATVGGVSQALHVLRVTLARRTPEWRALLNSATQGIGQIISANQILRLIDLADTAKKDPRVRDILLAGPTALDTLRGTLSDTRFVEELDAYFLEYGHRAVGESDIMTPRFAETPGYVLNIIRSHLLAGDNRSVDTVRREQDRARQTALQRIRHAFGWRLHEWVWFLWWRRSLHKYLVLREANRHALMHYSTGVRKILLAVGEKLKARGTLKIRDDIFFFTDQELRSAVTDRKREWKHVVALRQAERDVQAGQSVSDTIVACADGNHMPISSKTDHASDILKGLPVSAGYVEGPVCLIRSPDDCRIVRRGDILVVSVIDPGMAPLLSLASGLIAEMGGTLSHGAIIAREYGIPTVANVHGATRLLKDGERVAVDAGRGEIRRVHK